MLYMPQSENAYSLSEFFANFLIFGGSELFLDIQIFFIFSTHYIVGGLDPKCGKKHNFFNPSLWEAFEKIKNKYGIFHTFQNPPTPPPIMKLFSSLSQYDQNTS